MGRKKKKTWEQQIFDLTAQQRNAEFDLEDDVPDVTYSVDRFGYLTVYIYGEEIGSYHDEDYSLLTPEELYNEAMEIAEMEDYEG